MSLNPISSQSLPVLFIYLFTFKRFLLGVRVVPLRAGWRAAAGAGEEDRTHLEHLECSQQATAHPQGRGAKKHTQRAR